MAGGGAAGFAAFLVLATVLGFSIYLSMPIVYLRRAQGRWAVALNAGAVGLLLFLLADIFSNAAAILYPSGLVADVGATAAFLVGFVAAFGGLRLVDRWPGGARVEDGSEPRRIATIIAIGIGLQNLTEGLVFGIYWVAGTLGVLAVVFLGFFLQNMTEGFPIAAPFLGSPERRRVGALAGLFLIGAVPTVLGAGLGFGLAESYGVTAATAGRLFTDHPLAGDLVSLCDALAIGAIAYVILPMLRVAFRPLESREASRRRDEIVYAGLMVGFIVGLLVNAI